MQLFQKIPLKFLDNFKNPCWIRGESDLNCLPYFYIIGMYKCATTDVWDKLVRHPDVAAAPKEPHWWGPRRHGFTRPHPCDDAGTWFFPFNLILLYEINWFDLIWFRCRNFIWFNFICVTWYDLIWFDLIWYDLIPVQVLMMWYDLI